MNDTRIMREAAGVFPNTLAIGFAFAGHAAGLVLLTLGGWASSLLGFALLTMALCVAAYLTPTSARTAPYFARHPTTRSSASFSAG